RCSESRVARRVRQCSPTVIRSPYGLPLASGEHTMSMQLSPQAAALLGQKALVIITERVDDVVRLLGQRVTRGLPELLDRHTPRHGTQRGRSWGGTAVMWRASSVTEGDHRQGAVATDRQGLHPTRSHLPAPGIEALDLSDDRLSHRLQHVRQPTY